MEHSKNLKVSFMGLEVSPFTYDQLHKTIEEIIHSDKSAQIFNINVHAINLCFSNREFFNTMKQANYTFCDGEGVRQALRFYGQNIPYRITYADWVKLLLPWLAERGYSVAFLGSRPETIKKAVSRVKEQYPDLNLVGYVDGYISETEQIKRLQTMKADVLIVGMGMPKQEMWIARNQKDLPFSVFLSGGAVFDYLSKEISRAPEWMRSRGLEWLYRFILEPRRMFARYIIGNPLFALRVLLSKKPTDNGL